MTRTLVLNLPGLSRRLLDALPEGDWPDWLLRLIDRGASVIDPVLPAVTMPAQATYTTGVLPEAHGIVANGVAAFRDDALHELLDLNDDSAEYRRRVSFWEQSDGLLQAPRAWRGTGLRVAMLFFQSSIGAADIVVTPKPRHTADGRTIPDCWTQPTELNERLAGELGVFPLQHYWGPLANLESSRWIARCARIVWREHEPDLQFTYVPHLDYDAQRLGPTHPQTVRALADVLEVLGELVSTAENDGGRVIVLSEYGMTPVHRSFAPNVVLRDAGLLRVGDRGEVDYEVSAAFAMCDHQVAHVYCRPDAMERVADVLADIPGARYAGPERAAVGLETPRAGDIVLLAEEDAWFEYRWWTDSAQAPAWAWTVDIHRKPGYDPLEMFFDPANRRIRADQPQLVKGSHGARPRDRCDYPVMLGVAGRDAAIQATDVAGLLLRP